MAKKNSQKASPDSPPLRSMLSADMVHYARKMQFVLSRFLAGESADALLASAAPLSDEDYSLFLDTRDVTGGPDLDPSDFCLGEPAPARDIPGCDDYDIVRTALYIFSSSPLADIRAFVQLDTHVMNEAIESAFLTAPRVTLNGRRSQNPVNAVLAVIGTLAGSPSFNDKVAATSLAIVYVRANARPSIYQYPARLVCTDRQYLSAARSVGAALSKKISFIDSVDTRISAAAYYLDLYASTHDFGIRPAVYTTTILSDQRQSLIGFASRPHEAAVKLGLNLSTSDDVNSRHKNSRATRREGASGKAIVKIAGMSLDDETLSETIADDKHSPDAHLINADDMSAFFTKIADAIASARIASEHYKDTLAILRDNRDAAVNLKDADIVATASYLITRLEALTTPASYQGDDLAEIFAAELAELTEISARDVTLYPAHEHKHHADDQPLYPRRTSADAGFRHAAPATTAGATIIFTLPRSGLGGLGFPHTRFDFAGSSKIEHFRAHGLESNMWSTRENAPLRALPELRLVGTSAAGHAASSPLFFLSPALDLGPRGWAPDRRDAVSSIVRRSRRIPRNGPPRDAGTRISGGIDRCRLISQISTHGPPPRRKTSPTLRRENQRSMRSEIRSHSIESCLSRSGCPLPRRPGKLQRHASVG